ncbi:MAG: galactokinase [Acidobacteriota bacterium]
MNGLVNALAQRFGSGPPAVVARAPGRVNLIGEHTDYNQGFVMPTPIDRYVEVAARAGSGRAVRLFAVDFDQSFETELGAERASDGPASERLDRSPPWVPYVLGVVEELRALGSVDSAVDLAIRGTVPRGAGLSSSAALEVATLLALEAVFGFALDPMAAARLCHRVEHRWAGVRCGIMDQMASRLGLPGHALLLDCRDLAYRQVPLPLDEHALVIVDSGVRRQLAASAFNQRRRECEVAVEILSRSLGPIRSLREIDDEVLSQHEHRLPPEVARRCRHVVAENRRVEAAEGCLRTAALDRLGGLMTASHRSLRDLYEVSSPELDQLVDTALAVDGVFGSRLTGAGFGGCTVTLARRDAVPALRQAIESTLRQLGLAGAVLETGPAIRAGLVETGGTPRR